MSFSYLVYALLAGVIPSIIWLTFWLREDAHSEPRSLIAGIFFGGVISVIAAIFIEGYIARVVTDQNMQYTLWAATEEILKFIVVAIIALHSASYDEPIDAMIYCIVAALGFAALEILCSSWILFRKVYWRGASCLTICASSARLWCI